MTSNALPPTFRRLAWSNLAAQSAEQIGLAAAPIVAVLALGAGVGATGLLQTVQTLPFVLFAIPAGLLTLLRIPGLGPKKAKALHEELKIADVAARSADIASSAS